MARRNPMNQRYKKEAQVGATRKSAASAKPKRSTSSSSSSSGSKGSSKGGSKSGSTPTPVKGRIVLPPETKKLQTIVFGCLGVAVALSLLYLYLYRDKQATTLGSVIIGVSYGLLFVALYIDFTKVRPVMRALKAGADPSTVLVKKKKAKEPATEKPAETAEPEELEPGAEGKDA